MGERRLIALQLIKDGDLVGGCGILLSTDGLEEEAKPWLKALSSDPYKALGLSASARPDKAAIKKAWRSYVLKYHRKMQ